MWLRQEKACPVIHTSSCWPYNSRKSEECPLKVGVTWCSIPGSASELVLEVDVGCWPRGLGSLLVKLVIWVPWLEHFSHSKVGSWAPLLPGRRSTGFPVWMWEAKNRAPRLSLRYLKEPSGNGRTQTTEPAQIFFSPDGLGSPPVLITTSL